MKFRSIYAILVLGLVPVGAASAQTARSNISDGNSLYKEKKFADAEVEYRKSLEKDNQLLQGYFDLGDALYKQQRYDEAVQNYQNALTKTSDPRISAQLHHNIGNAHLERKNFQESIDEYKRALKLHPDEETQYNLAYAEKMLKQQQQQQKKQDKNDKNQQKKQDENKKQDQQQKKQQQEQQKQQEQQQRQQDKQMSRADAQRILDALKNDEKNVQKKLRKRAVTKTNVDKDW